MNNIALTMKEIDYMYHAIGLDYYRPSRGVYRPCRNYFFPGEQDVVVWLGLEEEGLAKHKDGAFVVTDAGLDVIEKLILAKIKR